MTGTDRDELGDDEFGDDSVAVVGLAGRFPGSPDLDTFWQNLIDGVDCLTTFTPEELAELGIDESISSRDNFVPRGTVIDGYDRFDAERFGFSPREAAMTDPQSRLLLETAHAALEHAGYDPFAVPGEVGVFAGSNPIDYATLLGRPDPTDSLTGFDQMIGNDRDFLATRISHRLGLTGPAFNVQTACSTSLVAIHLAAQHLLDYHCSMALAGGVSLNFRQGVGYFYQPGMILSPDGKCRAFDNEANGTTLGQGAGIVVLKRLADAIEDGDTVHAVIAASALNNDGDQKISYTAPSVEGQASVIATAQALAGLTGDDITYVEAHGTGTNLGDPVEVAALTKAFRLTTDRAGHCAIGSVKTNIGHTDAAAGVAGFIKAVLAVREGFIPKTLHFETANEAIDFERSPFFVATETTPWRPTTTDRRRAGISSFGIGGTNAHIIVEQPDVDDQEPASADNAQPTLLVASAPTEEAANASIRRLSDWASAHTVGADEANTLVHGRRHYAHRAVTVADPAVVSGGAVRVHEVIDNAELVLMFSGQGAQFPGMATGLHGGLSEFTKSLDDIVARFRDVADLDLAPLLLGERSDTTIAERLRQTEVTQPALFAVQMAMTHQLKAWGVTPAIVLGHSIGEFAAAVTAGILSLDDGVRAVAARGRLMQAMPTGSMLATRLTSAELAIHLPTNVEIATLNSTRSTVAAGPHEDIAELMERLDNAGVEGQILATSHAFHSESMTEAADAFAEELRELRFSPPSIPMLSNVTGTWLTNDEAVDPEFWAGQIRQPVRFVDCLAELTDRPTILCEVGPGRALSSFATQHESFEITPPTVQCLGHQRESRPGNVVALEAVGQLWATGVELDWEAVHGSPFERRRPTPPSVLVGIECWRPEIRHVLAMPDPSVSPSPKRSKVARNPIDHWCFERSWTRVPVSSSSTVRRVVVFVGEAPHHDELVAELTKRVDDVVVVKRGDVTDLTTTPWTVAIDDEDAMSALFKRLEGTSRRPDRVVHAWLDDDQHDPHSIEIVREQLDHGVNALLKLARGTASLSQERPIHIDVLTCGAHDVLGGEIVRPAAAAVAGPVKVIPLEYSGLSARQIDLSLDRSVPVSTIATTLLSDPTLEPVVALRGKSQWVHRVEKAPTSDGPTPIRRGGSYLILGGLGGVGLSIAEHLASNYGARLTLTSRSGEPQPDPDDAESMRRHERLTEVRAAAQALLTLRADVTSTDDLQRVINEAFSTHGDLDGVIVTAAIADNSGAIHRRTAEAAEAAISAKVHGAVLLAQALEGIKLDFVMLSSSIASQLYHNRFGQVGYVTANSFAEAMAESGAFEAERVVTVAWDDWVDIGMSIRAAQDFASKHGNDISLMDEVHSFTPADGVQVFERALRPGPHTLFVSTTDLDDRIVDDREVISPFLAQALATEDDSTAVVATVSEAVHAAWSSLLGIDHFGEDDDFFELGGDSLQVARMADRLSRTLEADVPLDLIFDNAAFVQLVAAVEAITAGDPGVSDESDGADERTGLVALAPSQRRFFDRGSLRPHHFNVSVLLRPNRHVTFAEITGAVATLEDRHAALRTRFQHGPDGWLQHIDPVGEPRLHAQHHDLSSQPAPADELNSIAADLQCGFDLEEQPLARVALFDSAEGEQRLLVIIHHLVSDRLSLLQIIAELDQLLSGQSLRPTTTPFSNWSAESAAFGRSPEALDLMTTWNSIIPHHEATLPGCGGKENTNRSATDVRRTLSAEQSAAILRSGDARADEIALIALSQALREWSGIDQPVGIDVLGHGRRDLHSDVSRTAGFFLSYSPVWLPDAGPDAALRELRDQLETAWTFDPIRFANPSATLHWVRPRVLFNYVGRPIAADAPDVIQVVDEPKGSDTDADNRRDHDVAVMVGVDENDLVTITAVYSSTQMTERQVEDLLDEMLARLDRTGTDRPAEPGES